MAISAGDQGAHAMARCATQLGRTGCGAGRGVGAICARTLDRAHVACAVLVVRALALASPLHDRWRPAGQQPDSPQPRMFVSRTPWAGEIGGHNESALPR